MILRSIALAPDLLLIEKPFFRAPLLTTVSKNRDADYVIQMSSRGKLRRYAD